MPLSISSLDLMRTMTAVHKAGIKLEVLQGLPLWEPLPVPWITLEIDRVRRSINVEFVYLDMAVEFPDGSTLRPDVAIYARRPDPTQEATRTIPEAVIEVVSPASEIKDMELSPPFYLLHGIKDVVVFDPRTGSVAHFRRDGRAHLTSPSEIALECGCSVTV